MISSDEPGVYLEGEFGVRLENEILCREAQAETDGEEKASPSGTDAKAQAGTAEQNESHAGCSAGANGRTCLLYTSFDEELQLLNKKLIEMGAQCEEVIRLAAAALTEGRAEQVQKVKPMDAEIDRMERDIESLCLKLLLQQQPVARDLRQISAALKMITDMELSLIHI